MTLTMIISIIAVMLFGVFCVLCLYFISRSRKELEKNETRMKEIENQLGSMTELMNTKAELLETKLNEQPVYNLLTEDVIDVNPNYPYDTPVFDSEEAIDISDLFDDDMEDILTDGTTQPAEGASGPIEKDDVITAFMDSFKAFEEEVLGSSEAQPAPRAVTEEPGIKQEVDEPLRHHKGEDVGRSGRKYTVSELEALIR